MRGMIYYLVTNTHQYTLTHYLHSTGRKVRPILNPNFKILPYEHAITLRYLPVGIYIFSDLERLSTDLTVEAIKIFVKLQEVGATVLNNPITSMRRYELLRTLYENGVNEFDVYRPSEHRSPKKYPVFLHSESNHSGSSDELITDFRSLEETLIKYLMSGQSREDTLIEEYCDTCDGEGIFRKYSALRIDKAIIPLHIEFGKKWMLKNDNAILRSKEMLKEEEEYIYSNPHREQLKVIFEIANISYGRIDYSFRARRIQVWEINTNPYHSPLPKFNFDRKKLLEKCTREMHTAFLQLDAPNGPLRKILNPARKKSTLKKILWKMRHKVPIRIAWAERKIYFFV
jgi:hypothetical protein